MYARRVSMLLKPNASEDFTRCLEADVIPLLRKQAGFKDEIVFTHKDGKRAFAISFWDRKESADDYAQNAFVQVTRLLENSIEENPKVAGYEVSASTLHAPVAASKR